MISNDMNEVCRITGKNQRVISFPYHPASFDKSHRANSIHQKKSGSA